MFIAVVAHNHPIKRKFIGKPVVACASLTVTEFLCVLGTLRHLIVRCMPNRFIRAYEWDDIFTKMYLKYFAGSEPFARSAKAAPELFLCIGYGVCVTHGVPTRTRTAWMVGGERCPHRHSLCARLPGSDAGARERADGAPTRRDPRTFDAGRRRAAAGEPRDPDCVRQRL